MVRARHATLACFLLVSFSFLFTPALAQPGCLDWTPGFSYPGADGNVSTSIVFDDGNGEALYVGGNFDSAFGTPANRIVRWNGEKAMPLGLGMDDAVYALAVWDDGTGHKLYAGGGFDNVSGNPARRIARWNGTTWNGLGTGILGGIVQSLAGHDDGGGSELYAGGGFTSPGLRVASWNGTRWRAVGSGFAGGAVLDLVEFDAGGGLDLYAAGSFTSSGGDPVRRIARWDGSSWSEVGGGADDIVFGLAVWDDGSGPALYAAGEFITIGGVTASGIAKWDGSSWSAPGGGLDCIGTSTCNGRTLLAWDDGSGEGLFLGGSFDSIGGVSAINLARWDGSSWSPLGSGTNSPVETLAVFPSGAGSRLVAGGSFQIAGGDSSGSVALWDGSAWSAPTAGQGVISSADDLLVHDDGSGPALYAAGPLRAGNEVVAHLGRWDGSGWSDVGGGRPRPVAALASRGGVTPLLAAGGSFTPAGGGYAADGIAVWDGSSWTDIGAGFDCPPLLTCGPGVSALAFFHEGAGPRLFAGGFFTQAGGVPVSHVARWDGTSWSDVGGGVDSTDAESVAVFRVWNDGSGPALFVGGQFETAGGSPAGNIARWDGTAWTEVGGGTNFSVSALEVFDDGGGEALFVAGVFTTAGGQPISKIARWDGATLSDVGGGVDGNVFALKAGALDGIPVLAAAGVFSMAGGSPAHGVAFWDGTSWSPLGSGITGTASSGRALAFFDDPGGASLYVGGPFEIAGDFGSTGFARYGPTNLPSRRGNVNRGMRPRPTDVLFLDGRCGDPIGRRLTVPAGVPLDLSIERSPAAGSSGVYALWILDGDPGDFACAEIGYRKGNGTQVTLGIGPRCLPTANTFAPGSCACGATFPTGFTSKGLGAGTAARVCLHPRPALPRSPTTLEVSFPPGTYTVSGVVSDAGAANPAAVSLTNWIVVTAE